MDRTTKDCGLIRWSSGPLTAVLASSRRRKRDSVSAAGIFAREEGRRAARETVDPHFEKTGALAGIIIEFSVFPAWDRIGAMDPHLHFLRDHYKRVRQIGIVTDSNLGGVTEHLASKGEAIGADGDVPMGSAGGAAARVIAEIAPRGPRAGATGLDARRADHLGRRAALSPAEGLGRRERAEAAGGLGRGHVQPTVCVFWARHKAPVRPVRPPVGRRDPGPR